MTARFNKIHITTIITLLVLLFLFFMAETKSVFGKKEGRDKFESMWVVTLDMNEKTAKAISWEGVPDSSLDMWNWDPDKHERAKTSVHLEIIDLKTKTVVGTSRVNYAGAVLRKGGSYQMQATGVNRERTTYHIRRTFRPYTK